MVSGGYCYLPQGIGHTVRARTKARAAVIEKIHEPESGEPAGQVVLGNESDIKPTALMGDEALRVCALEARWKCGLLHREVNTMTYHDPGAALRHEVGPLHHGTWAC